MAIKNLNDLDQKLVTQLEGQHQKHNAARESEPWQPDQEPAATQSSYSQSPHPVRPDLKQTDGQKPAAKQPESQVAFNLDCNIAILQPDLRKLRKAGYKAQTFRLAKEELDWLKNQSYKLSRLLDKQISQGDLIRIGQLLFKKVWKSNKQQLLEMLEEL
jgi:hypothetical protein